MIALLFITGIMLATIESHAGSRSSGGFSGGSKSFGGGSSFSKPSYAPTYKPEPTIRSPVTSPTVNRSNNPPVPQPPSSSANNTRRDDPRLSPSTTPHRNESTSGSSWLTWGIIGYILGTNMSNSPAQSNPAPNAPIQLCAEWSLDNKCIRPQNH